MGRLFRLTMLYKLVFFVVFTTIWSIGLFCEAKKIYVVYAYGTENYNSIPGQIVYVREYRGGGGRRSGATYSYKVEYVINGKKYSKEGDDDTQFPMRDIFLRYQQSKVKQEPLMIPVFINKSNPHDASIFCSITLEYWIVYAVAWVAEIVLLCMIVYQIFKLVKRNQRKKKQFLFYVKNRQKKKSGKA